MNWLLIVVVLLIIGHMVWGYSKGFLRVGYSFVEWILILVFVTWATPYVADYIMDNSQIASVIEAGCVEGLKEHVTLEKLQSENPATGVNEELRELGITLPEFVTKQLLGTGEYANEFLSESGIYEELASKIAYLAVRGISFLVVFLVAYLICRVAGLLLNIVDKIPVVSGVNRTFGIIAGFIKGALVTWVLFAIIAICAGTEAGMFLVSYIYDQPLLQWIYENNLVLTILIYFFL